MYFTRAHTHTHINGIIIKYEVQKRVKPPMPPPSAHLRHIISITAVTTAAAAATIAITKKTAGAIRFWVLRAKAFCSTPYGNLKLCLPLGMVLLCVRGCAVARGYYFVDWLWCFSGFMLCATHINAQYIAHILGTVYTVYTNYTFKCIWECIPTYK